MILVTGGAGYIGSHTVKLLLEQVTMCSLMTAWNLGIQRRCSAAKIVSGRSFDKDKLNETFEKYAIDAVIHFAAYAQSAIRLPIRGNISPTTWAAGLTWLRPCAPTT